MKRCFTYFVRDGEGEVQEAKPLFSTMFSTTSGADFIRAEIMNYTVLAMIFLKHVAPGGTTWEFHEIAISFFDGVLQTRSLRTKV